MRLIYAFFLYLLTPWLVLRLYWKSIKLPAYRQHISERFSLGSHLKTPVDLWVHAVSLGEVVAVSPFIELCLARSWQVLVTTMTPTGREQVKRRFGSRVLCHYVPYDMPWCIRRFYNRFQPRRAVIMETELWPNLIAGAHQLKIPLLLMNARISDKAFKQYQKLPWMFKPILNQFTAILAQSEEDAQRFIAMGASELLVKSVGNMKCDMPVGTFNAQCAEFKELWGKDRSIVIAASTHHDEERQFLSRFNTLKAGIPGVVLLFAPRHPERFQEVYQLSLDLGFRTGRKSQPLTIDATTEVIIIDAIGELLDFYQLSDYAFVGGSLVPIGGHNVLEPIAVGVPVFCGPHMQNSKAICEDLCAQGALVMRENADLLISALIALHQNKDQREQQITKASAVLESHRGTIGRCLDVMDNLTRLDSDAL